MTSLTIAGFAVLLDPRRHDRPLEVYGRAGEFLVATAQLAGFTEEFPGASIGVPFRVWVLIDFTDATDARVTLLKREATT